VSKHDWIPEPSIILLGCQPWPPNRQGDQCPVCGPGVLEGHDSTACAWCDSLSPLRESQVRAANNKRRAAEQADQDRDESRAQLKKDALTTLTELQRRRIWLKHGQVGREWLREIGQEPDFELQLDRRGRVIKQKVEV
jgi:uncharacterized Zn finger protein (UPF0148 family)